MKFWKSLRQKGRVSGRREGSQAEGKGWRGGWEEGRIWSRIGMIC